MVEWTKDQSNQITDLYRELKKGKYEREANQKLFGGPQLPYSDAFNTLTSLIKQQESEKGGLEQAINRGQKQSGKTTSGGWFNLTPKQSVVGLAAVLAGIALLSGIYIPPVY